MLVKDLLKGEKIDISLLDEWIIALIPEAMEIVKEKRLEKIVNKITIQANNNGGHSFEEWYEWAMSLYIITAEFKVISKAKEWNDEKSWECDDKAGALERIFILIGYKIQDRNRDVGNMNKDLM